MSDIEDENELPPSELGTKEYWASIYERDINNFDDHGDVGEIWFGEDSAERILRWMEKNICLDASVADLGCGNGMFLVEASNYGFKNLTGFDYCQQAIDLAEKVAQTNQINNIKFKVFDLIDDLSISEKYDILVDKGTYDAISLSPDNSKECRIKYLRNISKLLRDEGCFIMTSCNWTEAELVDHFKSVFKLHKVIPTPVFKFGGKEGNLISTIVFKVNSK